jgi:hypothetical protein
LLSTANDDHICTGHDYSISENIPNNLCSEDFEINCTHKSILLVSTDFDLKHLCEKNYTKKRKVTFGETTLIPLVDADVEHQDSPTVFVNPDTDDENASLIQKTRPQKMKQHDKDSTQKRRKRREVISCRSNFSSTESFRFEPNMQFVPIFEL